MNNAENVLITNSLINAANATTNRISTTQSVIGENNSTFTLQNSTVNTHFSVVASNQKVATDKSLAAIYLHNNNKASLYSNTINIVSDGSTALAISQSVPTITLQTADISIVNDAQPGLSELIARSNKLSIMNQVNQLNPNGQVLIKNTRGLSIYNSSGAVQVELANNNFNISNIEQTSGVAKDTYIAGLFTQADNQSNTVINSSNNQFNMQSTMTSMNNTAYSSFHRGIDFRVVGGFNPTISLNSKNDAFSISTNVDGAKYAFSDQVYGIFAEKITGGGFGSNITINTQGDIFNLNSNVFSRHIGGYGVFGPSFGGIYIRSRGNITGQMITVNSTGDTFNINKNLTAPNALVQAGADAGIAVNAGAGSDAHLTVNAKGDNFNIRSTAQGAFVIAYDSFGALAEFTGSTITLTDGNVFKFLIRDNGAPGPVIPELALAGATIIDDGTNKFLIY
jgi:hypothetical protein